jgi:HAD superfamily hydrolase (TIGR01509 family)
VRVKALIFDVDGTLADTEDAHRNAFNDAFAAAGLDWHWDPVLYRELLRVAGGRERIAHFIDTLPLAEPVKARHRVRIPELHADKTRRYVQRVAHGQVMLRPGVARLMTEARMAGVRLALATTTSPQNVVALIGATLGAGALDWFASRVCGDAVAAKKPSPDVYLRVLSDLGLRAEDCVALEDSANGLRAAVAAGLSAVVTPTAWSAGEDFSAAALVIAHLGDSQRPLDAADAARAGGPWLGLGAIERLRAARADEMEVLT